MAGYDPAAMIRGEYFERLTEIYKVNDKSKLNKLDGLLDKYAGKEHTLYMKVCQKYREPIMGRYKGLYLPEFEHEPPSESEGEEEVSEEEEEESSEEEEDAEEKHTGGPVAWHLLIRQISGNWFSEGQTESSEEELFCALGRDVIENYRSKSGKFKFLLKFPNLEDDRPDEIQNDENGDPSLSIVWTQTESPYETGAGEVELLENAYGEAFDGIAHDEDEPCFFNGGGLHVGQFECSSSGALCGPLDAEWGEPMMATHVELYVAVPPLICMPLRTNTRDSNGRHHGRCEGDAVVKDGALFCPKGTEPRCVCIKHHDDFKLQRTMTTAIWFQKHFRGQSSACLVSKGEWRRNFSLVLNNQTDGDYIRGSIKSTQGLKKVQNKFKDISEFDILKDKTLNEFHVEDADYGWQHAAMTMGDNTLKLYINGEQIAETKNVQASINNSSQEITLGSEQGSSNCLEGRLFDFVFYNKCLEAAEIQSLVKTGRAHCDEVDRLVEQNKVTKVKNKGNSSRIAKMQARMAKRNAKKAGRN